MIRTYDPKQWPLFRDAVKRIQPADVLLDVGAGIRPQQFIRCRRHICIEPHGEYADILRGAGMEVIQAEAPAGLSAIDVGEPIDTVVSVDVIEHLEKDAGLKMVAELMRIATKQVVIFTPLGFMPQHGGHQHDPWGMQGQHWQEHRSGWGPEDFPGWECLVDHEFHRKAFTGHEHEKHACGAFFAIWRRP